MSVNRFLGVSRLATREKLPTALRELALAPNFGLKFLDSRSVTFQRHVPK